MSPAEREIIVVDDDPGMSEAIERLLAAVGWRASSFASAEDFLESDGPSGADAFVFDIHLPGMSGIELHRHLAAAGTATPVIYITGHDLPKNREIARERGVPYLVKPFAGSELIDAINCQLRAA